MTYRYEYLVTRYRLYCNHLKDHVLTGTIPYVPGFSFHLTYEFYFYVTSDRWDCLIICLLLNKSDIAVSFFVGLVVIIGFVRILYIVGGLGGKYMK